MMMVGVGAIILLLQASFSTTLLNTDTFYSSFLPDHLHYHLSDQQSKPKYEGFMSELTSLMIGSSPLFGTTTSQCQIFCIFCIVLTCVSSVRYRRDCCLSWTFSKRLDCIKELLYSKVNIIKIQIWIVDKYSSN